MTQQSDAYAAFTSAWNTGTLPDNTTGTPLTGLTTANKLTAINAWMHSGTIPTTLYFTGAQLKNCVNYAEFKALTAQQQSNLLDMCADTGQMLGGSAQTAFLPTGMIIDYFLTQAAISSGTYNNSTGVVTLTMAAPITFGVGGRITVAGLTGTGAFASLDGIFPTIAPTSGSTITYNAGAGLGASTITGGHITPPTITELTALAVATPQPWWQFINALRQFDMGDVAACGLS
jgi:hypothetical protein